MQQQLRLSLHAADMLIPSNNTVQQQEEEEEEEESGWIVQTTEDGSEQYYYNTRTQEMRYSIPPEIYMDQKVKQALASSNGHLDTSSPNTSMNDIHDQFERPPVRPVRAANRALTEDPAYNTRTVLQRPALKDDYDELEFEDDERVRMT